MRRLPVFLALLLAILIAGLHAVTTSFAAANAERLPLMLTMTPSPVPTAIPSEGYSVEAETVLATLNGLRGDVGVEPLAFDARLMAAAEELSRDRAKRDRFEPPTTDELDQLLVEHGYAYTDMYHVMVSYDTMSLSEIAVWWNPLERLEQVLRREFTHVGIADVTTDTGRHYLNVIFAQPAEITPEATSAAESQQAQAETIVRLMNEAREARGLHPLEIDERLMQAALRHSEDMAERDDLTHTGSDGSRVGQRVLANGYIYWSVGEVILQRDTLDTDAAFEQWWDSPDHRAVLLTTRAAHVGVGYARSEASGDYHYTLVVARH